MKKNMFVIISFFILLSGCSAKKEITDAIYIYTSILPQKYFVERIGGNKIFVDVMVKPGQNPATYEPLPGQIVNLAKAPIFFTIGVPFEKQFIPKIKSTMKNLKIIDTSEGIKKRFIENHSHNDEENNFAESSLDPHVWLAPNAVKIQANIIFHEISLLDPANIEYYRKNFLDFINELDTLHNEIANILAPFQGRTIYVFHPAFGYFTDEFGLKQEAIETGGKEPTPAAIVKIIEEAKKENITAIYIQPEFSKKSAQSIANTIGATVIELNPLSPDYSNNLRDIANNIRKGLE
jgi:zinc transport system substrate-binding protein